MTERPMLDVVSMGRTLVDLYPLDDGPLEDVSGFDKAVGGSPTNVAIASVRLGHTAGIISRVGDDGFGRFARRWLQDAGVDVAQIRAVPDGVTPVAICEISPPDRFPLTIYRPEPHVDTEIRVDELDDDAIAAARILWMSLSGLAAEPGAGAHRHAVSLRGNRDTILDLDYRPVFWPSEQHAADTARTLWGHATVLIGNLAECRIVTGAAGADAAADALLATGARLVIVKLGEDGVLAATADRRVTVAPIPVRVANGLGSGDAFGGALCHGLLSGWDLDRTVVFANAAGALVATRRGCSTAMPSAAEVDALLMGTTSRPA